MSSGENLKKQKEEKYKLIVLHNFMNLLAVFVDKCYNVINI